MAVKVKVKVDNKNEYICIPAIALRGLVLFPDNLVHFDVGREKSIKAIEAAMKNDRLIYLVPQVDFDVEDPKSEDMFELGVVAEVKQVLKLQENAIKVLVETKYRAKTVELKVDEYITAVIKNYPIFKIKSTGIAKVEALVRTIKDSFEEYIAVAPRISKEVIANIFLIDDPNELAEYIAANIMFKIEDKIKILSENSPEKRLSFVLQFLSSEYKILKIENEIKQKVQVDIDKCLKEYYLRQQMKTISEELDEDEDIQKETDEYRNKIIKLNLIAENQEKLLKEVSRLEKMSSSSQESAVSRNYLDICMEIPWNTETKEQINVQKAEQFLNKGHYGLEKVKEKILEILSVRKLSGNVKGQVI
ncbi:MAG: LON peptidase substrate-binding domain-containing protein, partial [Oscillospiraceae bacterium]